jgi:hypothetical protein
MGKVHRAVLARVAGSAQTLQIGDASQMTLTLRLDDTTENRAAGGFKHDHLEERYE